MISELVLFNFFLFFSFSSRFIIIIVDRNSFRLLKENTRDREIKNTDKHTYIDFDIGIERKKFFFSEGKANNAEVILVGKQKYLYK